MAMRAAVLTVVIMTLLSSGCAFFSGADRAVAPASTAMPLTKDNVDTLRLSVARAKAQVPKPAATDSRNAYLRFARQVYVHSWIGPWSPAATTETALAKAKAGETAAREYLTIMVYDLQLQSAMEGVSLSAEDWHDIYVGSGIMTEAVFANYAAMSRAGKVLP